jgi:hypothetical protein
MSSPSQAPEKKLKTKGTDSYLPPPETALGAPVPRAIGSYADAHTPIQEKILELLKNSKHGGEKREDFSFSNKNAPACEAMAQLLGVDHSTISRNIQELAAKKSMQVKPLMSGGRRMGTEYFIYCYDDALKARRNAPEIARREDGKFLILGRGKHFMTPHAASLWNIKLYGGRADISAPTPNVTNAVSRPIPESEMEHVVVAAVAKAIRDGTKGVSKELVQEYIRRGRATALARVPPTTLSADQIAEVVRETRKLAKNQHVGNPHYFLQTVEQRVNGYLDLIEDGRNQEEDRERRKTWVPLPGCPVCGGTGERLVTVVVRGMGALERAPCDCLAAPVNTTKATG